MRTRILLSVCALLIALGLSVRGVGDAAASPTDTNEASVLPYDVWLTISNDGRCLFIEDGHVVRFEGQGEIKFGTDRRRASVVGDVVAYVDGERVSGELRVRYGQTVELRSHDSRWILQPVSSGIPNGQGARISDDHPDSGARVESDDDLVFYMQATYAGGAEFYYPTINS
jgi:hypothetical protein